MNEKYKHEANQLASQYLNLIIGADQDKAIDLINIVELLYCKLVSGAAAAQHDALLKLGDSQEEANEGVRRWCSNCLDDISKNLHAIVTAHFTLMGKDNPFADSHNAKLVAEILSDLEQTEH